MRKHEWRQNTEDGDVRFVSATRQGARWRFRIRLKSEDDWSEAETLEPDDLQHLRELLWRKSQRRRCPVEWVDEIDALIEDAANSRRPGDADSR